MARDTKSTILIVAATIFARDGFEGASVREIMRIADVNAASVHYHFGSKGALYRAVVERWLIPNTEVRARALEDLRFEGLDRGGRIAALVRSYIEPHLSLCADPDALDYLRLIARWGLEPPALVQPLYSDIVEPVRSKYVQVLAETVPEFDLDTTRRIFGWVAAIMSNAPLDLNYESMTGRSALPADPAMLIERVTLMATGGILAVAEGSIRPA